MKKKILFVAIALLILGLTACSASNTTAQVTKEGTINIGYIGPLTGNLAHIGDIQLKSIELAVNKINSEGGINGEKVRLIAIDDKHLPADAVQAAQKLIQMDSVVGIVGPTGSSNVLAIAPIVNKEHIPLISPIATSPEVREAGKYIFRTMPDTASQAEKLADYANNNGLDSVAILYINNAFGKGTADAFAQRHKNVLSMQAHEFGETDHRTSITKALQDNPDAIFIASYFVESASIIKQLREMNYKGEILAAETAGRTTTRKLAGDAMTNVIFGTPTQQTNKEYAKEFQTVYGEKTDFSGDTAYDAFMLLVKAVQQCGTNGEEIQACLYKIGQGYEGVSGTITFDEKGDVNKPQSIFRITAEGDVKLG